MTLVVNERSGGGRAGRMLPKVVRRIRAQVPDAELHIISSSSWPEAEKLTRAAALEAQPGDALVVMGGDGMVHLGLNAAAGTQTTLGLIPAGTGNDFARGIGVPRTIDEAVGAIIGGRSRTVDLTRISNSTFPFRYVGAVVSTGYDARVNRATNHIRLRLGALSYGYIALRELASFSPLNYDLVIDGEARRQEAMLVAVANSGLFGGGMRIAPDADPADGLLDITIIGPVSRTTLLRLLPTMYSGQFVKHPCVEQLRAKRVEIAGEDLFVMGDGEELGDVPVIAECAPGVLRIFVSETD
ncbi:MAG: YegS/Rv2252/BmrU family lipid kinase [Propionibacteriaceae bacterium]|nr:YegS/Rv2252/BmrU family lipid kinase [Propionibacteriaceae bacterium]